MIAMISRTIVRTEADTRKEITSQLNRGQNRSQYNIVVTKVKAYHFARDCLLNGRRLPKGTRTESASRRPVTNSPHDHNNSLPLSFHAFCVQHGIVVNSSHLRVTVMDKHVSDEHLISDLIM